MMIASLRGNVIEKSALWLLLEVGGIGYRIKASPAVLTAIRGDEEVFIYTYHHIREDAEELFGFLSLHDLELFEQLLAISGIGPKVALTILSIGSADTIKKAIMSGNLSTLTSVPGVGKKMAQKIILELKGQIVEEEQAAPGDTDLFDALMGLGYSANQARDVMKYIPQEMADPSERIREALRLLSKS